MASGDFLELAQRACYQARFRPEHADDIARAKEAINEAYLSTLDLGRRWSFLEREASVSVTSANDTYSVSSVISAASVAGILEFYNFTNDTEGGRPLANMDWLSMEEASRTSQDGDSKGTPTSVAIWGNSRIRFYPWPDKSYDIGFLYLLGAVELTNNTDLPLIPAGWRHRILVPYAAMRLWEQQSGQNALGHAQYYRNQYEREMATFTERFGSARIPQMGLDGPTFSADLPGSLSLDYGFWVID